MVRPTSKQSLQSVPAYPEPMTTRPGWYPMTTRPGFQCYWDGNAWTDNVAPIAPPPTSDGAGMSALTIMLGILMAGAVIWFGYTWIHSGDDAECASRNLDHAMAGEPTEDCG